MILKCVIFPNVLILRYNVKKSVDVENPTKPDDEKLVYH